MKRNGFKPAFWRKRKVKMTIKEQLSDCESISNIISFKTGIYVQPGEIHRLKYPVSPPTSAVIFEFSQSMKELSESMERATIAIRNFRLSLKKRRWAKVVRRK